MQPLRHGDRGFGVCGAFHIDPHKAADACGVLHQIAHDALSQIWTSTRAADIHAHLGKLYAHIRAQFPGLDRVQQVMVNRRALLCLRYLKNALAQRVERDLDALRIQPLGHLDRFVNGCTCDEPAGHFRSGN